MEKLFGSDKTLKLPTILWYAPKVNEFLLRIYSKIGNYDPHENILHIICLLGMILSAVIITENKKYQILNMWSFTFLWIGYVSIQRVAPVFMAFQQDTLLIEVGFLGIFFIPTYNKDKLQTNSISIIIKELLKWLLFRFLFANGMRKLLSDSPEYWSVTALHYHLESQPLPHYISWWLFQLPELTHQYMTACMLIIEIFSPFLIYSPFNFLSVFSGILQINLVIWIMISGNNNYLSILLLSLTLIQFQDYHLIKYTPSFIKKLLVLPNNIKLTESKTKIQQLEEIYESIFKSLFCFGIFLAFMLFLFPLQKLRENRVDFDKEWLIENIIDSNLIYFTTIYAFILILIKPLIFQFYQKTYNFRFFLQIIFGLTSGIFVFYATIYPFYNQLNLQIQRLPFSEEYIKVAYQFSSRFGIANQYSQFSRIVGQGSRPELVVEGSYDARQWQEYIFKYKPQNIQEYPPLCMPYSPRLDYQNSPAASSLLKYNPFDGNKPPLYLRIRQFNYQYTKLDDNSSNVWIREYVQDYLPTIKNDDQQIQNFLNEHEYRIIKQNEYPIHFLQKIPVIELIVSFLTIILIKNLFN